LSGSGADEVQVNLLVVAAAWSVLSVPAALVIGGMLGHRPTPAPQAVPVRARR
jgi:hypothetical protein